MTTSDAPAAGRGYSSAFVARVHKADPSALGVQLALLCIERNIPAAWVAEQCGVTRQVAYRWFLGGSPRGDKLESVEKLLAQLRA